MTRQRSIEKAQEQRSLLQAKALIKGKTKDSSRSSNLALPIGNNEEDYASVVL